MRLRSNIFDVIRRRGTLVGRFVLAFFAFVSLTAGAAPCVGMALEAESAVPEEHPERQHEQQHEQDHEQHHGAHVAGHHEHSGAHSTSIAERAQSPHHCPHCPQPSSGHAATGMHAFCAAANDVSDVAQPGALKIPPLKHVLATPLLELPPPSLQRPSGAPVAMPPVKPGESIALNVRHCVFLI
jgi:hypothetical protein